MKKTIQTFILTIVLFACSSEHIGDKLVNEVKAKFRGFETVETPPTGEII